MWDPMIVKFGLEFVDELRRSQGNAIERGRAPHAARVQRPRMLGRLRLTLGDFLIASGTWLKAQDQAVTQEV